MAKVRRAEEWVLRTFSAVDSEGTVPRTLKPRERRLVRTCAATKLEAPVRRMVWSLGVLVEVVEPLVREEMGFGALERIEDMLHRVCRGKHLRNKAKGGYKMDAGSFMLKKKKKEGIAEVYLTRSHSRSSVASALRSHILCHRARLGSLWSDNTTAPWTYVGAVPKSRRARIMRLTKPVDFRAWCDNRKLTPDSMQKKPLGGRKIELVSFHGYKSRYCCLRLVVLSGVS